jgi:hypothetical protein
MYDKTSYSQLLKYREELLGILTKIDTVLQSKFPSEHSLAYQHWIPQIITALNNDTKWLPRGSYSMEYTLNNIKDKISENDGCSGVSKYIHNGE